MKGRCVLAFLVVMCVLIAGCAEIKAPKPDQFFKDPLGEGSLKVGMTKTKVIAEYGEPNAKRNVISRDWNHAREEWLYKSTYSGLPAGIGYLSEDLYIYFDGESLTNVSRKPLGEEVL